MLKNVIPLGFIVASRFFALFIILPVISLYALELRGSNEFFVGLLVGIYAIMQMIFQVPFGLISDKIGRKKTMVIGLVIFTIGSLICAMANDIYTMLLGRCLQGIAAIGAVATAMISDFTTEEQRSKAMAIMGGMIGISFTISMPLSPILGHEFGLSSLFYISVFIGILSIVLLYTTVEKEPKIQNQTKHKVDLKKILLDKDLTIMNFTNFMQKMLISIAFISIPIVLVKSLGYEEANLWKIFSTGAIFGFFAMGLAGFLGDAKGKSKQILIVGVLLFILSYTIFAMSQTKNLFIFGVMIFFIGFNIHEPIMQSCASKFAKANEKGAVLGVFNSSGFFGSFVGGVVGGAFLQNYSLHHLAICVLVISIIWLFLLYKLTNPSKFKNIYLDNLENINLSSVENLNGIIEIYKKNLNFVIKYNSSIITEKEIYGKIRA
ncbi:MFS transporter [Campylobacter sputorum]|uniref:MFS transporter n=1 Tax=Campylobacter sputorum TaxID=206 RepID=UPI00053BF986|nr:MFS transporter [Campylobacter sputorum]